MNRMGIKFAASSLVLAMTMVACSPAIEAGRAGLISARTAKADQDAGRIFADATAAGKTGDYVKALDLAEKAVALAPRDVGYRMLLADLYMKNGRFQSAATTFGDVLTLDPVNVRAGLQAALAEVAIGRGDVALARLDSLAATAPAGDIGLAYALAGQPNRAISILEPAARAPGATGRIRQNLALAYAFAGDWQKARAVAAQDVSPADLSARLQQWAALASPSAPADQIAGLFGVRAVADSGQPVSLALAPVEATNTAFAAAEPVQAHEPTAEPAPAPVQLAQADVAAWEPAAAPTVATDVRAPAVIADTPPPVVPEAAPEPSFAPAVRALVNPEPAKARLASIAPIAPKQHLAPRAAPAAGEGRFVVQIGAYSSPAGVERAWASAYRRYGLTGHQPRSTTVSIPGKGKFHRLSVAGFESHADASKICASVRSHGGACFVRATAGDAPVRWASRYDGRRA
jgi:Flp pilus assembly protein TadD